jgi:hypothetical protein
MRWSSAELPVAFQSAINIEPDALHGRNAIRCGTATISVELRGNGVPQVKKLDTDEVQLLPETHGVPFERL